MKLVLEEKNNFKKSLAPKNCIRLKNHQFPENKIIKKISLARPNFSLKKIQRTINQIGVASYLF